MLLLKCGAGEVAGEVAAWKIKFGGWAGEGGIKFGT